MIYNSGFIVAWMSMRRFWMVESHSLMLVVSWKKAVSPLTFYGV